MEIRENRSQRQLAHTVMYTLRNMLREKHYEIGSNESNRLLLEDMYKDMVELNNKRIESKVW